jgi:phosphohistidine swiveling domain-containing protein/DNA-binding FrmR family transcriptional regulator
MIYKFDEIKEGFPVGGKAKGLNQLHQIGFKIPQFVVITLGGRDAFFENPKAHFSWMTNGNMAVRSSGMREDGIEQSFAGQFESYLNLTSDESIVQAVKDCIDSGENERVKSYDSQGNESNHVAVIIQEMVDAKYAGVAFSADPVFGRRDISVINIVEGLGDKLVDGKAEPEQIEINRYAKDEIEFNSKIASDAILLEINEGLIHLKNTLGHDVDTEWAVNQNDELCWLQVRPITALPDVHPNELDSKLAKEDEILTRANIGEMMPGYLTPLSLSTFGRAIEYGIQDFYMQCGVQKEIVDEHFNIKYFYNHGFISLTGLYAISDYILLPKNEYIEYSILGRELDKKSPANPKNKFIQIKNQVKQFRYFGKAKKSLKALQEMCIRIHQPENLSAEDLYKWIDGQLHSLNMAYSYHYCTSGKSGSQYTALISVITGAPKPSPESNRYASHFLKNIDGIVGADSINQLKNLAKEISEAIPNSIEKADAAILETLHAKQGSLREAYQKFIHDHGHRCVREAELAEKDWSQAPEKLIPVLRSIIKSGDFETEKKTFDMQEAMSKLPKSNRLKRFIIKKLANSTREAVFMREMSKSCAIKFQQKLKFAYLDLAKQLKEEGILRSEEDLFYLTHKEIGLAINGELSAIQQLINDRKRLNKLYASMSFNEVYCGHPYPTNQKSEGAGNDGTVVSQGKVKGKIKVVRSLEEADKLEKGDIMVCQYTDIGWSPYFAIIGGIITEIGSPLSHGAVVAREYGIPAIVNMHGAMDKFKDNEEVEINTDLEAFIRKC